MFPRRLLSVAIFRMLLPAALLLASCSSVIFDPPSAVDLAPFKDWARARGCDDIRNRLFLIDDQLVFSDIAGNCADGSYGRTLFGSTPDQVLCVFHDSIAGPVNECQDERYRDIRYDDR
jgi:hypothetical protein